MEMLSLVPLAPRIFDLFDNNRDGTVDMREIIGGFSSLKYSQGDDALRLCFQVPSISFKIILATKRRRKSSNKKYEHNCIAAISS